MNKKDLSSDIRRLAEAKHAVILAHYYTEGAVQDVADFVGDSLALAQQAAKTEADIIVMCGVHFMAETCKILCPAKKVLIPDPEATCSLAESCPGDAFAEFVRQHPDHKVISYVNTSAAVKAVTDVVVTSSNARQIVESLPKDALVLAHPECKAPVLKLADVVGSTARLLNYAVQSECREFIVVTESGILHEMQRQAPEKLFIPVAPEAPETPGCSCNECNYMRLVTLEKLYRCLKDEAPEVVLPEGVRKKAERPIRAMLFINHACGMNIPRLWFSYPTLVVYSSHVCGL